MALTFIPPHAAEHYRNFGKDHPDTKSEWREMSSQINRNIRLLCPNASPRTVRRWTLAFYTGTYTEQSTNNHYFVLEPRPIVPIKYSQRGEYYQRMTELRQKQKLDNGVIRCVNAQDTHANMTDPGLIELRNLIVSEFDPHLWVVLQDDIDNLLINPHGTSSADIGRPMGEPEDGYAWEQSGLKAVVETAKALVSGARSAVDTSCLMMHGGSNHFAWVYRYLLEAPAASSLFFDAYFDMLKDNDVLWAEADQREYEHVTDRFIWMHGRVSRKSYYGATAMAYLRKFNFNISVAAGHTHRMETVYSPPDLVSRKRAFVSICGTLGDPYPGYTMQDYTGHIWGFSLISAPPEGLGGQVEEVEITLEKGWYETRWRGQTYRTRQQREWAWENPLLAPLGA